MASSGGPAITPSGASVAPTVITVGASPFIYQNINAYNEDVIVNAGTVTALEFSRDNITWYPMGALSGTARLSPSDRLRTTYTAAPTMTRVPR